MGIRPPKTIVEKADEYDVCAELRKIVKQVPKKETVLLPAIRPSKWFYGTIETSFETVKIHKLLQFIADMIE